MTIDLTTVTEVDPNSHLSSTTTTSTFTGLSMNETAYQYLDYGAAYVTNRVRLLGEFLVSAGSGTNPRFYCGLSDAIDFLTGSGSSIYFAIYYTGAVLQGQLQASNAGTEAGNNFTLGGSLSTPYYYAFQLVPGLGQYGGLWIGVYSDSARTTLVVSQTYVLVAQHDLRYFMPVSSSNAGTANSITGTNANLTLSIPDAGVDVTAFTEVDSGSDITVSPECIVVDTMATNVTSYIYKDYGVDNFGGDYNFKGVFNLTAFAGAWGAAHVVNLLSLVNTLGKADSTNDCHAVEVFWVSTTSFKLRIREVSGGTKANSATYTTTCTTTIPIWVEFYRDTAAGTYGTLYLKIYRDPAYSIPIGSDVTLAARDNGTPDVAAFRYLNAIQSSDTNATPTATFKFGGVQVSGGSQSASYTSDGGFRIGGSATNSRSAYATGSGGIRLGGSATHSRSTAYIATGGFIIGGAADFSANGAASVAYTSSGGFVIGGTAANSRSSSHTGSGGFRLGGSAAYSFTLQTNVQEIVFELYDSTGAPITGATTLTCKLRTTPGAQIYDWSDETFKSSGWTTISADLNEIDATNLPGVYKKEIDVSNFADGRYQVFITYSATQSQHGSIEFLVDDGQMVDEYIATNTHTALIDIAATPAAVLAAATATPIAANMEQTNGIDLKGDGTTGDKFRSTLIA